MYEAMRLLGSDCCDHPKDNENHLFGCNPETGFDCSGLVVYVLTQARVPVPKEVRHTSEFFDHFGVFVHKYRAGDLVFFSKEGKAPIHMGIMINDTEYIHSPGRNGTKVSIAKMKREPIPYQRDDQIYLENPIGFKAPTIFRNRWQQIV